MAFLIPDNLKSRQDVNSAIRRCASAFEIGLDDSNVVWYEPLYDPSGERPHLVLMLPERGICVMEVAEVKVSNFLGIFKGKPQFSVDGQEIENPIERASKFAEVLANRLKHEPRVSGLGLKVSSAICFVNMTAKEAKDSGVAGHLPPAFCLYKDEIDAAISGNGESALMRAFTRIVGPMVLDSVSSDIEKILRGLIQPDIVIGASIASNGTELQIFRPPNPEEDILRVMDKQQEAMAKSLGDGHRVIRGVAGSGKTLVLVYRAKLLAQSFPKKKIVVTCFTKTLAAQLRGLLLDFESIEVAHLNNLMDDVIKQAKLKKPKKEPNSKDNSLYYDKITELALSGVEAGAGPRYDVVMIDEAQDFSSDQLKFAVGLLKEDAEDLVIVADAAQNIFKRRFNWKQAGVKAQGRTRILRTNYRNTQEILQIANSFLMAGKEVKADEIPDFEDENSVIPPESAKREGPRPIVEMVDDVMAEVNRAVEIAAEWCSSLPEGEKIAILYPGADEKDRGYWLNRRLNEQGIENYWTNKKSNYGGKTGLASASERIILTTIQSAKGLEFPYVILCGITFPKNELEQNRKLVYVGMTRATEKLVVVSKKGHPLAQDLERVYQGCGPALCLV